MSGLVLKRFSVAKIISCLGYNPGTCSYCFRGGIVYVFEWKWTDPYSDESGEEWEDVCERCLAGFFDNEADPIEERGT